MASKERKIKGILFDFDGTLVDTNDVIIESFQATYEKYLGHRVETQKITEIFGEPLQITLARELPGVPTFEAIEYYRAWQKEHALEYLKGFEGVTEMLDAVKEAGYRLAIVTSRTTDGTVKYLRIFDYEKYFETMVSCDDTSEHKPNPAPINLALEKLGLTNEDVVMIGDGPFDMKCANNAGVKSILVGWRITEAKNALVEDFRVDYELEKPMDLIGLLKKIEQE